MLRKSMVYAPTNLFIFTIYRMATNEDGLCLAEKCDVVDDVADVVSPVEQLVHDWGYEPIMPRNEVQWEQMSMPAHITVGIYLLAAGLFLITCLP